MSRIFYLVMLLIFSNINLIAQEEEEHRIITFFENYYSKPDNIENQNFLNFNYGLSFFDSYKEANFSNHYSLEANYGFFRIDDNTKMQNISRFAQDYAFLGNISTNFKTFDNISSGIDTDIWRFGFGISDGFVYNFGENSNFYLTHSSDWIWSRIDFIQDESILNKSLIEFNEKFKFGNRFHGGIRMQLYKGFNADIEYEHTLVYPAHVVPQWLGMWLFDNFAQRWFDYFEPEFVSIFGRQYPWVRFIYKNGLSYLLYEARTEKMFFPFESASPLSLKAYKIGITFIF